MTRKFLTLLLIALLSMTAVAAAETPAERDARMAWWRHARFGMFIHWGLYSVAAGQWKDQRCDSIASWIQSVEQIPPDQYAALRSGFTASRFDPAQWAALAKRAGMKYAVLTSKHHEGFCLFDSKFTDFDVMSTPAHRDIVRDYLNAFHAAGLKAGLYYSVIDWHNPNFPVKGDPFHPMRNNPEYLSQHRDLSTYVDYLHNQVRELLTNYGPVDVLWWDFSYRNMSGPAWRSKSLITMCRQLQPNIIMNNRLYAGGESLDVEHDHGDFATPEQHIPPTGLPGKDWETCMTINNTWGYKSFDLNYKTSIQLIRNLIDIASKGGNYLLNVGPRADGSIPDQLVERLEAMGDWLHVNGESIYDTTASPFPQQLSWGRVTTGPTKDGVTRLYLHVFDWPITHTILLPPLDNKIRAVTLLDGGDALEYTASPDGVTIHLPRQPRDEAATVLVMEIEGQPTPHPVTISPEKSGEFHLAARDALLHGNTIHYPSAPGQDSIGYWTNPDDWVSWTLHAPKPGRYTVSVTYGCASAGGEYTIEVADQKLTAKSQPTGGWFTRRTDTIGTINLPGNSPAQLTVHIASKLGDAVLDLEKIELKPQTTPSP